MVRLIQDLIPVRASRFGPAARRAATIVAAALLFSGHTVLADDSHQPIGDAIRSVPIFDAHVHYKQEAWKPYPTSSVIKLMDLSGVAMALVSSTPDEGTIRLFEYAPSRIVPELRPYHGDARASNWTEIPGMADYLRERLEAYPHRGIGEFHLHNLDTVNRRLLRQVTAMAKAHDIPLHVHSGAAPVHLLYELEPDLTIIWAHAGLSEPVSVVDATLAAHPTLYADTSYRENDILASDGTIDPAWRRVIERFADRLMVGSDTWMNFQWDNYHQLISRNRLWLSHFPRDVAEKIAFRNAERLFKRKVDMDLIGTR